MQSSDSSSSRSATPKAAGYGFALVITLLAWGLRINLDPFLGTHEPFFTFYIALAIVAWFAGTGPAVVAALGGLLLADWSFLEPRGSLAIEGLHQGLHVAAFGLVAATVISLIHLLRSAEARLRREKEEYQANFEWAIVGQAVGEPRTGRFLRVNEAFCLMTGYSRQELLQKSFADITCPEDVEHSLQSYRQASVPGSPSVYEKRYIRKDGRVIWARVNVNMVRDSRGNPLQTIGIIEDITESKQADIERRLLAAIVEFSDDAIISKDLNGIITSWNKGAERIFGYSAAEAIGQPVMILIPPERADEEHYILECLRCGERIDHLHTVRLRKDAIPVDVSITSSPVKDSAGRIIGFSKIARDISRRKRAEEGLRAAKEQLAQANAELEGKVALRTAELEETIADLEHFSYTITHDMRAPLRALRGFSDLLVHECRGELAGTHEDYLRRISEAAQRMDHLITDALSYSAAARQKLELTPVDPGRLLRGMIESYPAFHPIKGRIHLDPIMPLVLGNEAGLTQCFSNLIDNAIKFVETGREPEIRIWAEPQGEVVLLWVEDRGIGIPEEFQGRIFDMFQRFDKSREGTGIGLALVRKVAERMQGEVGVISEPGQGSRFWLRLKAAHPAPAPFAEGKREELVSGKDLARV